MTSRLDVRIGSQRPRLKHLPPGRVSSAGADCVEFAATCGLILDDWQAWCLDQLLAEDVNGEWCAQLVALLLPRQNGKNAVLEALELYAFYVLDERRIIHTAHLAKTAADHMNRLITLIRSNPELDEITTVYMSNGKEALQRNDTGARLEFITRGKKTARGGSPNRIVFDEALFLSDEQIQAIIPALSAQSMNAAGPPQLIYTSSAPLPDSDVLHRIRQRGMSPDAGKMFFAEWSCELGVDPTDREAWYQANPGLGIRISEDWIAEQELPPMLSEDAFLIERLGVVVPQGQTKDVKLPADKWAATKRLTAQQRQAQFPTPVTFAFDVSKDGEWASIAYSAGSLAEPYVEVIEHRQSTGWVPARLVELVKQQTVPVACNGAGPAGALVGPVMMALADAGCAVELKQLNAVEYKQACGGFYQDVVEGRLLRHKGDQGPLDLAAADAAERVLGDAWAWDLRSATVPISPLVAVTIARALLPVEKPAESVPLVAWR